ncbi:MAG: hypothetical protein M4579_004978 [Chaenotheca gracillima]|nr:MAG: hypothetical protein M4579_004978 [Chaenotheca gracillima]
MASIASAARPTLLRQLCVSAPAKRTFASKASSTFKSPAIRPSARVQFTKPLQNEISRTILQQGSRIAAFHASGRKSLLPPGPQHIDGTVNDPAIPPQPSPTHGSYHWTFERLVAAALIPLTIAPFAAGTLHPITDAVLCGTILIHSHIGFQSIIIDYIPTKRLPKTRTLFWWGLRAATLVVGVGLYEFETNDVGMTEAVKRIWTA